MKHLWNSRLIAALLGLLATNCSDFDPAEQIDPAPFTGCYSSEGGPNIQIGLDHVQIAGLDASYPTVVEKHTVGATLVLPLSAVEVAGKLSFEPAESRYYRFVLFTDPQVLQIASHPKSILFSYHRMGSNCNFGERSLNSSSPQTR